MAKVPLNGTSLQRLPRERFGGNNADYWFGIGGSGHHWRGRSSTNQHRATDCIVSLGANEKPNEIRAGEGLWGRDQSYSNRKTDP
jgi:hypothetical protein